MTNLITPQGLAKLQNRYDLLWKRERPAMVKNMADAAAEGDRSENAEYIYSKKRLREIDRELKHLGNRIKVLKVAYPLYNPTTVSFGCWVTFEEENGDERCYRLVGADEFDVKIGHISAESPVAKALFGKKVDDEVTIKRPAGEIIVTITDITSQKPGFG